MAQIAEIPWNGYNVVSTFSGAGGSCLGYRMAGYRVVWANEFVPAAQDVYRANHPKTFLNTQDIRDVTPEQVLRESGLDEVDVLDGSPPCAAFSTAGIRENGWGRVKKYSDTRQRVDDLFFEYIRLLDGLQPKVFIAENVSGLVKGTAKGYFKTILSGMKACGYEVSAKLLNAAYLGVPQSRERVIFVGVRRDLCERYGVAPVHPRPRTPVYTLADAFEGVENDPDEEAMLIDAMEHSAVGRVLKRMPKNPRKRLHGDDYHKKGSYFSMSRESMLLPCSTIQQSHGAPTIAGVCHPLYDRRLTIPELKRVMSLPDDFILTGTFQQKWERCGRMVPPVMMREISSAVRFNVLDKIGR